MIYLDNSATTIVLEESAQIAQKYYLDSFFNPAAMYGAAVQVEKDMETARKNIASTLLVSPEDIIFTSGGTESNNMAILGTLKNKVSRSKTIITSQVEHPSVYNVFRDLEQSGNYTVKYVGCNPDGTVNLKELESLLSDETYLVSIMHVNNELGSVNNLPAIRSLINTKAPDAIFHSDGVQAFCKVPLEKPSCDLYSISGHKLHAPKGIGVLYANHTIPFKGGQIGGGQERNLRSGTSNVPGIMGLDASVFCYKQNQSKWNEHMKACKKRLYENLISLDDVLLNGPSLEESAPHILNMSFLGVRGEVLINALSDKHIYASTGSACSEKLKGHNRILTSVGIVGERQEGALRFSFSHFNQPEEMDQVADEISKTITLLRKYRRR